MTSLYKIKQEYLDILANPLYVDFETWEIIEAWEEALKNNQDHLESKCDNIARYMKILEWESNNIQREIDRLTKLKRTSTNKIDGLKKLIDFVLDGNALNTELFRFSYRKSEKAEILEKDKLPNQFITQETIEKIAWIPEIKKYLKTEIEARIEELKADWKWYFEEDIKTDIYSENGLNITFNNNLQIK